MPPLPPRILAITGGLVTIGGAEKMVFASLRCFSESGSIIHCIVNDWENDAIVAEAERIGAAWSKGKYKHSLRWRNQGMLRTVRGLAATTETSFDLIRQARTFKPAAIFVSDFETLLRNSTALAFLRARGIPAVLYLQNSPPESSLYRVLYRRVIDPLVSRYAVASRHTEGELTALGISASKISYVNNFVEEAPEIAPESARDPSRVLFAGQMIPQKGLDILLEAFASIAATNSEAHLDVASKIEGWIAPEYAAFREAILARVQNADLHGRVTLLGWRNDVPALLRGSGVHCAASRPEMHEGMPLVCLEAKQASTPTVAPADGAFSDLITHRVDGWLCERLAPDSIANGLRYFLDNVDASSAAGQAARASLSRFSQSEFSRRWGDCFAAMTRRAPQTLSERRT